MCEEAYGENYSRRVRSKEVANAVARVEEAQSDYHKACEHAWDVLYHSIPNLEEVLKIGKRGYRVRIYGVE